jgi:hypothetical protein
LVDEFYFSAVFKCFDPLFVWHSRISSGEIGVCREHTLFGARNRGGRMKSRLLGIWHSNCCTENYTGEPPLLPVFARTNNFLNHLTEGGGERSEPPAVHHASTQQQSELPHSANQLSELCSLDQPKPFFPGYPVYIEEMNSRSEGRCSGLVERNNGICPLSPKSRYPNSVKLPNHLCHMLEPSPTQTVPRGHRSPSPPPPARS